MDSATVTLRPLSNSQLGSVLTEHYTSLPIWVGPSSSLLRHSPWLLSTVVLPAVGAGVLELADTAPGAAAPTGLLAGIGVLGGLLFQVLAWVSSRMGTIADEMDGRPASPHQLALLRRLDIARANIAYAALVSVVFVMELGVVTQLESVPSWVAGVGTFMLLHLGTTLILVISRINSIGKSDRVAALTDHARRRVQDRPRRSA